MEKVQLEIIGLSYSQTQSGAYALVLSEKNGKRRLPIVIGGFEAQSIAIELEGMTPSRPLTHDLFTSFAKEFEIEIKEVIIYNLIEGIFFSKLICIKNGKEIEIDARTSDAIAIAVRFGCPIFAYEFILSSAGIILEDNEEGEIDDMIGESASEDEESAVEVSSGSQELDLEEELKAAIANEDYEKASKIRDEINKKKGN